MEIIIVKSVRGIGVEGDVRNVKPGYFRNYLLPNGIAIPATESASKIWEKRREQEMIAKNELREKTLEISRRLEGKTFNISKRATSKGTLYSAVSVKDMVKILADQAKIEIDPASLILTDSLKKVGTFETTIGFSEGVLAKIFLNIQAVEKPAEK